MSRPSNYWHGMVKRMVMRYPALEKEKTIQSEMYVKAIEKTNKQILAMADGDIRMEAIKRVCFDKQKTAEGVAYEMHYSFRTIQNWVNDYVRKVGINVGF